MSLENNIKNPATKYRPIPFWSWNDKLEPEELQNQVRLMNDVGISGYFMHARGGLLTEYMGKEWFEAVDACLEQGAALSMDSWAYDENGWPSGFGSGKVNGLGLKYQQKYLRCETVDASGFKPVECTVALYSAGGRKIESTENIEGKILHLYYEVNKFYVDTLDLQVTEKFIEEIYQKYYDRLCEDGRSGKEMAGFFTDEPQISRDGMPWSFIMADAYRDEYGEDLLEVLAELFVESGNFRRTRYRIWKLISKLFMNNFMKPIYDWCEEHGWKVTGHHVCEESYWSQLTCNGSIMPQYQYYHIPGMDWLGRHIKPVTTPVQVASVCAQRGKKQILSETFALCGWNVKLEELKWIFQWQMVHGINLLCQHLESYSLKGIRKRDYPASLFRHQPWWKDYRAFNDYVSRIGVLLAEGEIKVDTLVLHGQSSAWLEYTANERENSKIEAYFDSFKSVSDLLDSAHINYHYGDETMIEMHGSVSESSFIVGKQKYSLVIIPQVNNISENVYKMLKEFTAGGGKVLAVKDKVGDGSCYVSGEEVPGIAELKKQFIWFDTEEEMAASINEYTGCCPVVSVGTDERKINDFHRQQNEINYTKRYFEDFEGKPAVVYYFVNNDQHEGYDSEIYLPENSVERFEPATGDTVPVKYEKRDGKIKLNHYFVPSGDLVLIAREADIPSASEIDYYRTFCPKSDLKTIDLNGAYDIELKTDNLVTLDYCSFSFDGELQEENEYVLSAHDRLIALRREVDLEMNFKFNVDESYILDEELFIIMERPELFDIKLNGRVVANDDCGYMYDPAFKKIPVKGFVKHGENIITLNTVFKQSEEVYNSVDASKMFESEKNKLSYDMEIEAIYLAGNFGVKTDSQFTPLEREAVRYNGDFSLSECPKSVEISNIHESGLPFFSGTVVLKKEFEINNGETENRYLKFDAQKSIVSKIKINGKELSTFLWKPFVANLDGFLHNGSNIIEIELSNSLRNMLGPHHLQEGESYSVGPFSFYKEEGVFARNWAGTSIPWDDGYCFVEFGMDNLRII